MSNLLSQTETQLLNNSFVRFFYYTSTIRQQWLLCIRNISRKTVIHHTTQSTPLNAYSHGYYKTLHRVQGVSVIQLVARWTTDHHHPCQNLGVGISEECFIFDFAALALEVARPIQPTMRTKWPQNINHHHHRVVRSWQEQSVQDKMLARGHCDHINPHQLRVIFYSGTFSLNLRSLISYTIIMNLTFT